MLPCCQASVTEHLLFMAAVIPPFHSAIDHAISYLDPNDGFLGVTDFYVSSRYDLPCRQLGYLRRFFWRYHLFLCGALSRPIITSICLVAVGTAGLLADTHCL